MNSKKLLALTPLAAALLAASVSAQVKSTVIVAPVATAAKALPENMAFGLRELIEAYQAPAQSGARGAAATASAHESFRAALAEMKHARVDADDRVLVDVYLDGKVTMGQAVKDYEALGATVIAKLDWYHQGALSLWVPVSQAATLAEKRGVSTVQLALKPRRHIGAATSQGAVVLKTEGLNASGYKGAGVTVGALSDSFDSLGSTYPVHYAQQQASGDLPGPSNPNGYTTPVTVLKEYAGGEDEGRAMLEIVHDLAPAAKLMFNTAYATEVDFAAGIVALQAAGCNVIVDDVGYYTEAMFSDGPIGKAVDKVNALGVSYFSSAGNDDSSGYAATFTPTANDANAQAALAAQGVPYTNISVAERGVITQFHSFGTNADGSPILVQNIRIPGIGGSSGDASGVLVMQWDDPYNLTVNGVKQVTTDYDILVFNSAGAIQNSRSGMVNNITTNAPIEFPNANLNAATSYKIVIVKTNRSSGVGAGVTPNQATHIRYAIETNDTPARGDFMTIGNPETHGHPDAAGATGVAAYRYDVSPVADIHDPTHKIYPVVEQFSSNGPVVKYFDANDQRLAVPVTRKQPLLAAVDGTDSTFFPPTTGTVPPGPANPSLNDFDGDGYPNFFGTSAAAPHAAGVAAVLLGAAQAQGITLSPADVRTLLTSTTQGNADQTPNYTSASAGPVTVGASGYARTDNNFFRVDYAGAAGTTLNTLTVDLSNVGIHFDTSVALPSDTASTATATGVVVSAFNGAIAPPGSNTKPSVASYTVSNGASGAASILTITFANFAPGAHVNFGIGRRNDGTNVFGQLADPLGGSAFVNTTGATISATTTAGNYTGSFTNPISKKWNYKTGYGLIDAQAALNKLLGSVAN